MTISHGTEEQQPHREEKVTRLYEIFLSLMRLNLNDSERNISQGRF